MCSDVVHPATVDRPVVGLPLRLMPMVRLS
jgi:hypothetical protein